MRSVTGIELGAESCVLVRVRRGADATIVSAVHGLAPHERRDAHETLSEYLRPVRRKKRFPRRARVVAWGLPAAASPTDAATLAMLGPLRQAGFVIDDVLTPAKALAVLACQRSEAPGRGASAWVAVNRHGAAIAIAERGELLYERELGWNYRQTSTPREELLQRYTLVAYLAPEVRHGFDVVGREQGTTVNAVITCGDLPDLRSLTMPLTEELDIEVETLDSLDGLTVMRPLALNDVVERSPALRLACAAGSWRGAAAAPTGWLTRAAGAAAAVALIALVAWAASFARVGSGAPPAPSRPAPVAALQTAPPVIGPLESPAAPPGAVEVQRPVESGGASRPAATTGRQEAANLEAPVGSAPAARRNDAPEARVPSPVARPETEAVPRRPDRLTPAAPERARPTRGATPLKDPLPAVNSILVAPDRRLAVLDGAIVREGDAVGRRTLVRIEPGAVVLREPSGHEVRVLIRRRVGSEPENPGTLLQSHVPGTWAEVPKGHGLCVRRLVSA